MSDRDHFICGKYSSERGNFFMLFIDDFRDVYSYGASSPISDDLDWTFCDNEWIFHQFMKAYDTSLQYMVYHTETFHNRTWEEFKQDVISLHGSPPNLEKYVTSYDVEVLDVIGYTTEEIYEEYQNDAAGYDVIDEQYKYDWFELLHLLNSGYFIDTPDVKIARKCVTRICRCYALIRELMYAWYNVADDRDLPMEEWFPHLPDYAKVELTKEADFPYLLDELEEGGLINLEYLHWHWFQLCFEIIEHPNRSKSKDGDDEDGSLQMWNRR